MFELSETPIANAVIKVVGVGGGGGNAVEHMILQNIPGVEFVCANTDVQALKRSSAPVLLQLGEELTKGLGAGADPEIGRLAAEENRDKIRDVLVDTDMVFITAGMGGGTGTGAAPIVAEIARELGVLTVAVVTKPFIFEGKKRLVIADDGINNLARHVDSLITVPNNKLLTVLGKNTSLLNAFREVNNVLLGAVQGIAELITRPGLINVDFADVRTVMAEMGMAMMGTAEAHGEDRAKKAAEAAISSPLLEDIDLNDAGGVLVNITAGSTMTIGEFEEIGEVIKSFTSDNATVVVGTVIDPEMSDGLRVTVVVTGLSKNGFPVKTKAQLAKSKMAQEKEKENVKPNNNFDLQNLDKPAILRQQQAAAQQANAVAQTATNVSGTGASGNTHGNNGGSHSNFSNHREPMPSQQQASTQAQADNSSPFDTDLDLLDIPAFLRRKKTSE